MPKINTDLHAPTVLAYRSGKETTVVIEELAPFAVDFRVPKAHIAGVGTARLNDRDTENQKIGFAVAYARALRDLADQLEADVDRTFRVQKTTQRLLKMLGASR